MQNDTKEKTRVIYDVGASGEDADGSDEYAVAKGKTHRKAGYCSCAFRMEEYVEMILHFHKIRGIRDGLCF